MFIKWAHMKLTFIIFKGKRNKSIRNQTHLPTNAYNRIKKLYINFKTTCFSARASFADNLKYKGVQAPIHQFWEYNTKLHNTSA